MFVSLLSDNARGRLWTLSSLAAVVLTTGCSKTAAEKKIPVFPVSGKVSFDGEVPVGAMIVLYPADPAKASNVAPTGKVKDDGSFAIGVYQPGDGAPAGDYIATIQWYKYDKDAGGAGPNVLPRKYATPKDSPIKVSVKAGAPTEIPPITIAANEKDKKKKG